MKRNKNGMETTKDPNQTKINQFKFLVLICSSLLINFFKSFHLIGTF